MKSYIHARLSPDDRRVLDALKKGTGQTESELVRRGLSLVAQEERVQVGCNALELAGRSVGRFSGPADLSTNPEYLEGFGE